MRLTAIFVICVFSIGIAGQSSVPVETKPQVSDLAWISGCWIKKGKNEDSFISETWTKPFGMMIGTNRTVRNGKVIAFEYIRIEERDSEIYYVAKPSQASGETSFKLIRSEEKKVVFENKDHDFPKRIVYSSGGAGELTARIEDDSRGMDFGFQKTVCDQ